MKDRGLYLLILKLEKEQIIKVGRLGKSFFRSGYYLYVGRAKRGLRARVERHLGKDKEVFWHIDYLLKKARITEILGKPEAFDECLLAAGLRRVIPYSSIPVPGFGASDCGCPGHLIYVEELQDIIDFSLFLQKQFGLKGYFKPGYSK